MKIRQILTPSATMWDALRNGGRFVAQQSKLRCATEQLLLRNKSPQPPLKPEKPSSPLCATVGFGLESANVVGYNTVNINKEYTLLSIAFDEVDGSAIDIQKAFPYGEGMTKGLAFSEADNIQIMTDDGSYETYFLSNGKYGKGGTSYNEALDGKWSLMGQNAVAERKLKAGTTFWYLARAGKTTPFTLTVAGQVGTSESETYTINKQYTLIGCPYPCEVAINGGIEVTGATEGLAFSEADNIQIMTDDGGYDTYFLSNGKYGKGGSSYNEALDGKWSLMGQNDATEAKFPVGKGAWYLSRSKTGTVKFINPITK